MPGPSQLSIATSSVKRLLKEESSYHKELKMQEERITKIQSNPDDENADYLLRQEKMALEETKAIFPNLRKRIADHVAQLEKALNEQEKDEGASSEEIAKAKETIKEAKALE